jgi:hypothetical protein
MESESSYQVRAFLEELRSEVSAAIDSWHEHVGFEQAEEVELLLVLPTSQASSVALTLYAVDREIRRAVSIVSAEFRPVEIGTTVWRTFPPIPIRSGGLELRTAEFSSAHLILQALGDVEDLLLSAPVQLTLTLKELLGWGRFLVRKRKRDGTETTVMSSEGVIEVSSTGGEIAVRGVQNLPAGATLTVTNRWPDSSETTVVISK